jgi:tRNA-binding protein
MTHLDMTPSSNLTWEEFTKVEMRIGTILSAEKFTEARNPAYKMILDFGDLGTRKTSAQITKLYTPEDLIGRQVVAVVNFPPKQIANLMSECLVLGAVGDHQEITLLAPERKVINGTRVG